MSEFAKAEVKKPVEIAPYRGLFPSPPLFDRMPTYRTQGKRSLNFLSADVARTAQDSSKPTVLSMS